MINVALIGYGYAGRTFHEPLINATPGLTLHTIAHRHDYNDAIASPDVQLVVIATPNDSHAPIAQAALAAGKHVVVDKPFTITYAEARELTDRAADANRLLSVFQNRRWDSDFLTLRRALDNGLIGEVVEFRSEISRWRTQIRDRWRERAGSGSGLWYDLGPHLIDQALVLFGEPQSMTTWLQRQRGGEAIDYFHACLHCGRRTVLLASSMLAAAPATRFIVHGTAGSLVKRGGDQQEAQLSAGGKPGSEGWGYDPDPLLHYDGSSATPRQITAIPGNYLAYYAGVRDAILGAGPNPVSAADACRTMAVIESGIRYAETIAAGT